MRTILHVLLCSFYIFSLLVIWSLSRRNTEELVVPSSRLKQVIYWSYETPFDDAGASSVYLHFRTRILPEDLCDPVTLLVIVHSKPSNLKARNSVRQSWGRKPHQDYLVLFLLGNTSDSFLQEEIFKESAEFGDIIQVDFVDTYANLTIKSISMLKLALHCDHSFTYLLKTDDDTLLNLNSILKMLYRDGSLDLLMGHLFCDATPDRNPQSKWYTPYWRYWYDTYPLYLSGGGYIMSWGAAQKIFREVWKTPLFHMEDIYLTGICAMRAGVKPRHSSLFVKKGSIYARTECFLKKAVSVFDVTIEEMLEWNKIMKDKQWEEKCSSGFSSLNWVFDSVFKSWENVFSYRRTCK